MSQWRISAEQLHQLDSASTVIFDCRFSLADKATGKQLYQQSHIPGAFHLDMENDLSGPKGIHGGRHPLPDAETFSARMRHCGVNQGTLVIAYDNNRLAGAARLWWLLRFFGHRRVRILDGGYPAWQAASLATTNLAPESAAGNFEAEADLSMVADYPQVVSGLDNPNIKLIDSREEPRYQGLEEPIDPVAGHIPGARCFPWQQITDDAGYIKPIDQQQQNWATLPAAKTYLVYCGSGVTACVNLLSLDIAGIKNTALYAGSWSGWCSYPDSPIGRSDGTLASS